MKYKIALIFLIVIVVLTTHSVASESVKSREKRSPKPQFGKLFVGLISRWIPKLSKDVTKVVKLVRKNPGTAAAGAVGVAAVGVGTAVVTQPGQKKCAVYIRTDLAENQPVFLKLGTPYSLMVPTNGYLYWAHGESSPIACPSSAGSRNVVSGTNNVVGTITCDDGLNFYLNGRLTSISQITCDYRVTGNFHEMPPNSQCAGTVKSIGFNVPSPFGNEFIDLFYSCFKDINATVLFTHHVLLGNEIAHKCIYQSPRPDFKSSGFTNRYFVSEVYSQISQKARLGDLFAVVNRTSDANIFMSQYVLQRGHLTPDADEIFNTWRWSTYFYINVAPMWDSINTGNWKNLEDKVRTLATQTGENLEIFTGTYETLELCTTTNYCVPFTLVDGGIPVPKWLWKIVKSPSLNAAIALVVSNNPFAAVTPICGKDQEAYGWNSTSFDQFKSGRVSYCEVKELQKIIPHIPPAAAARNILEF